ncbi:hypothetical protein Dda_8517 [Drechslerella dactyloides]|uniref:Uncharacterized protein n=1 Tax=Drechslerella dactyloides TaxID=74499 RepID=A0AAD6IQS5_DREDA|nr:hypothetical protein Dda_8517 [Drechslerella dactyloides]
METKEGGQERLIGLGSGTRPKTRRRRRRRESGCRRGAPNRGLVGRRTTCPSSGWGGPSAQSRVADRPGESRWVIGRREEGRAVFCGRFDVGYDVRLCSGRSEVDGSMKFGAGGLIKAKSIKNSSWS